MDQDKLAELRTIINDLTSAINRGDTPMKQVLHQLDDVLAMQNARLGRDGVLVRANGDNEPVAEALINSLGQILAGTDPDYNALPEVQQLVINAYLDFTRLYEEMAPKLRHVDNDVMADMLINVLHLVETSRDHVIAAFPQAG